MWKRDGPQMQSRTPHSRPSRCVRVEAAVIGAQHQTKRHSMGLPKQPRRGLVKPGDRKSREFMVVVVVGGRGEKGLAGAA